MMMMMMMMMMISRSSPTRISQIPEKKLKVMENTKIVKRWITF